MRFTILSVGVLLSVAASTSVQAQRRIRVPAVYQPQAQVEMPLSGDNYLFGAFNLQHFDTGLAQVPTFSGQGFRLGYEHFGSPAWSWGATLEGQRYRYFTNLSAEYFLAPELFGRHWNTFGQVNFRQRLGVSFAGPLEEYSSGRALASLRLDVDRVFPLGTGGVALRPRIAFEPVAYLRFQRDDFEAKEPFLDFSELRGEVGVRLSSRFDFTPWFAWQNAYSIALPQFDANGNLKIPGGNSRAVQPTVGLDLRITLGNSAGSTERRQLPTQY